MAVPILISFLLLDGLDGTFNMMQRRTFLKLSIAGAAVVAAGGLAYRGLKNHTPGVLEPAAAPILTALIPAMLGEVFAADAQTRSQQIEVTRQRVTATIEGLPYYTQAELNDLFSLMTLSPARRFLFGLAVEWPQATNEQLAQLLQKMRGHSMADLQVAYHALHDLICGAHYSNEAHWKRLDYVAPSLG